MSDLAIEKPPLVPEIRLHRPADGIMSLWSEQPDLPPPYFAFAWASGQALARFVLDHPEVVAGRRVLDLGTGSGLVTIAAALRGGSVRATDIDRRAVTTARANALLNAVTVDIVERDILDDEIDVDVILAADVFYERGPAERVHSFLRRARLAGASVLVSDPGRTHFSAEGFTCIASYDVRGQADLEGRELLAAAVYRLQ